MFPESTQTTPTPETSYCCVQLPRICLAVVEYISCFSCHQCVLRIFIQVSAACLLTRDPEAKSKHFYKEITVLEVKDVRAENEELKKCVFDTRA